MYVERTSCERLVLRATNFRHAFFRHESRRGAPGRRLPSSSFSNCAWGVSCFKTCGRTDVSRDNTGGSFNGSSTKIYVKPRIKKDIGLHVGCRRERAMNELGVEFMRRTNCVLY
jgi:hypothetical protein